MRLVWATFHYAPSTDQKGRMTWLKPKWRLCIVRHGCMIKGPDHAGFVAVHNQFKQHFRINDPMPLFPEEARRLTEETTIWRER